MHCDEINILGLASFELWDNSDLYVDLNFEPDFPH